MHSIRNFRGDPQICAQGNIEGELSCTEIRHLLMSFFPFLCVNHLGFWRRKDTRSWKPLLREALQFQLIKLWYSSMDVPMAGMTWRFSENPDYQYDYMANQSDFVERSRISGPSVLGQVFHTYVTEIPERILRGPRRGWSAKFKSFTSKTLQYPLCIA